MSKLIKQFDESFSLNPRQVQDNVEANRSSRHRANRSHCYRVQKTPAPRSRRSSYGACTALERRIDRQAEGSCRNCGFYGHWENKCIKRCDICSYRITEIFSRSDADIILTRQRDFSHSDLLLAIICALKCDRYALGQSHLPVVCLARHSLAFVLSSLRVAFGVLRIKKDPFTRSSLLESLLFVLQCMSRM